MGALHFQIVGNVGLFYTAFRLSQRGFNVLPTNRNMRGADLIVHHADEDRYTSVQVKALSKRAPVPLGKDLGNIRSDFWVIVTRAADDVPVAFVMLPSEVMAMAHRGEKDGKVSYWLQPRAYDVQDFRERWDRFDATR